MTAAATHHAIRNAKLRQSGKNFPPPDPILGERRLFTNRLRTAPQLLAISVGKDRPRALGRLEATGGGHRGTTMDKPIVRIENWSVVGSVIYHGYQNLEPGQRLTGDVMGHTNLRNGSIYTSAILNVDLGNRLVETHNSLYQLGQVDEAYARWMWEQERARAA